jgi:hypothetical protein
MGILSLLRLLGIPTTIPLFRGLFLINPMSLDDKALHYVLGGMGLFIGAVIKKGFDISRKDFGIRKLKLFSDGRRNNRGKSWQKQPYQIQQ